MLDLPHPRKIEAELGEGNHVVGMMVATILIEMGIVVGLEMGFGLKQVIRTVCRIADEKQGKEIRL